MVWIIGISAIGYVIPKIIEHEYITDFMNDIKPIFIGITLLYSSIIFIIMSNS